MKSAGKRSASSGNGSAGWGLLFSVLIFQAVLVSLFRGRVLRDLDGAHLGGYLGDAGLYVWLTNLHRSRSVLDAFLKFDTPAFYPYGLSLAWSDCFILPGLIVKALVALGINHLSAYNLLLLGSSLLNGFVTTAFLSHAGGRLIASAVAGSSFLLWSYFTNHLGHPQLQFFWFIPLGLLFLVRFLSSGRALEAFGLGLILSSCFLTTAYYAVFLAFILTLYGIGFILVQERALVIARLKAGLWMIPALLPIFLVLPNYLAVRETFGGRELYEAYYFSATALSFLASSPLNYLYGGTSSLGASEAQFFPGCIILVMLLTEVIMKLRIEGAGKGVFFSLSALAILFVTSAGSALMESFSARQACRYACAAVSWPLLIYLTVCLIRRLRTSSPAREDHAATSEVLFWCSLYFAFLFFLLSLGPLGNSEKDYFPGGVFTFFYWIFPGFNSIRAVARFGSVAIFFLFCAFAFASRLWALRYIRLASPLILSAIILENYNTDYPFEPATEAMLALSEKEKDGVGIFLPFASETRDRQVVSWGDFARMNVLYMHLGLERFEAIVNGYSGQRSKLMKELPFDTEKFPDTRSIAALSRINGLTHIVYDGRQKPSFDSETFGMALEKFPANLKLVRASEDNTYLIEFNPLPLDADHRLLAPYRETHTLSLNSQRFLPVQPRLVLDGKKYAGQVKAERISETEHEVVISTGKMNRVRPLRVELVAMETSE